MEKNLGYCNAGQQLINERNQHGDSNTSQAFKLIGQQRLQVDHFTSADMKVQEKNHKNSASIQSKSAGKTDVMKSWIKEKIKSLQTYAGQLIRKTRQLCPPAVHVEGRHGGVVNQEEGESGRCLHSRPKGEA